MTLVTSRPDGRFRAADRRLGIVFFPGDDAWLVEPDLHADHWDVVGEAD
jgi:hypothetical protein